MKTMLKYVLSVCMVLFVCIITYKANAVYVEPYTFDESTGTITDCEKSVSGRLEVPSEINGHIVTTIGNQAFRQCYQLTEIVLPNTITRIDGGAFVYCEGLESVTLPSGVKYYDVAFGRCANLKEINVSSANPYFCSVDGVLFSKDLKKLIEYPYGKGDSYKIPSGVKIIGEAAFEWRSKLSDISIPQSVNTIETGAFLKCFNITDIYYQGTKEQWDAIQIAEWNQWNENVTIHYNSYLNNENENRIGHFEYSNGEFLSDFFIDSENNQKAYLMFWHNYGDSASDEDFSFTWETGKWQYELEGNRSRRVFEVSFIPTENGMRIRVACKDGEYYSWETGQRSSVWVDAEYKGFLGSNEMPSSWAIEEITAARENGLIPENLDGAYQNNITRQEFCQLAVQLIESSIGRSIDDVLNYHDVLINESEFSDTNDKNVLVMNALHVVSGVGKGKFEPSRAINREEAATMLARLAKVLNASQPNDATLTFGDRSEISEWAYDSIIFVSRVTNKNGLAIMGGTGDNKFAPKDTYTREQAFLSFGRLFDVVQECTIGSMVVEKPIETYAGPGDQYRKIDSIYESAIDEYIYEQTGWLEVESDHRRVYVRKSDLSESQISDIPLVVKRIPYGPTPRPNIVFLSGVNRTLTCGVDIHSGPDFSYSVMSTLDPGTKLTILYQLPQKSITDINPFLLVEYETSDGLQRGYADKNTVMDIYNPLNGFDMVKQSNASFDYLGDTYYSTIASTTALDGWSTKYSTTISDIQFDFMAAVTGAIDSNDNNIDLVGETWMYDAKLNANIPVNTQNNGNVQNKVNGALDLIGMFNAALSSGNKSMAIQVDMQTYKNEGRIILRSGAPFETAHAGDQVLLSALIAQNGSALSLVERNKRADQLIRAICPEITGSGLWDMQITFSDDYSIDPYGYYYVFDKDANVYAHLILHPGTRFLVFQEEKERIDITGRIAGIQLQVDGEVRDRILQMLNENGIHLNT